MSELLDKLQPEFQDEEYRHAYADECLNTMIATQIKVLREQRGMTQKQLADATGMGQPRIPLLEDASYENWTIRTLKRFAKAFDTALSVKFETFSKLIEDYETLSRESLQRPSFANDQHFHRQRIRSRHRTARSRYRIRRGRVLPFTPLRRGGVTAAEMQTELAENSATAEKKRVGRVENLGSDPMANSVGSAANAAIAGAIHA